MSFYFYSSLILSNCLLLITFVYGISNKQLWSNKQAKWYLLYLGIILCIELLIKVLIYGFDYKNTSFTYPFYISVEFFSLSRMLILSLGFSEKWRFIVAFIGILLFLEATILWFNNKPFTPSVGKIFSHLTIISMAGYLLVKRLKELETNDPFLIIYLALFLYYSVSLFLFLLMDQLTEKTIVIWSMNNILSSILYGSSIYTFYKFKKSK